MITRSLTHAASGVRITGESTRAVLKEYAAILARNAAIRLSHDTAADKDSLAREAAFLFAAEIEGNPLITAMPMHEAIKAADMSDPQNNLGLLSGTLALQQTLSRMQYEYPMLTSFFTDFSSTPGKYKQTEMSRIVLTPAVETYNDTPDSTGRPKGWDIASPAQTVDVPVTLDELVGVPVVFGQSTLASTGRNLFGEIANQALYALGGYFVRKVCNLFTAANYNAYAATSATGGATTSGSPIITVTSTAAMYPGQSISGTGIPANSFVKSVTNSTTAVLNYPATATGTSLTFALSSTSKIPQTYTTYIKAKNNFAMAALGEIGAAFDANEVPQADRYAMVNAGYYYQLSLDGAFNTFFAATRSPEIINKGILPELQGFTPQKAPYFPAANGVGFAYHKSAAVLKARLPADFASALPGVALPGSVSTITDPNSGLSLLLVQRVSLGGMYSEWNPCVMIGASVGERRAGMVITAS